MSVIYYDPFAEFERLFDNAFHTRFPSQSGRVATRDSTTKMPFQPKMDIHEDAKTNLVCATFELAGLKKEDVDINVHNNRITISGHSKACFDSKEGSYAVRERSHGAFSRTLHLPSGVKPEEIKASMEHGILTVTFPKQSVEQAAKKITVN